MKMTKIHTLSRACSWLAFILCTFVFANCDDDKDVAVPDNWVALEQTEFACSYEVDTLTCSYNLASGLNPGAVYVINQESWCQGYIENGKIVIAVEASTLLNARTAVMTLVYDENHTTDLTLTQESAPVTYIEDFDVSGLPTTFNLAEPIDLDELIQTIPANASYQEFDYTIAEGQSDINIDEEGRISLLKAGEYTFTVISPDEHHVSKTVTVRTGTNFGRTSWVVKETSAKCTDGKDEFNYLPDATGYGMPECMFDGTNDSFFSMLKPGKTLGSYKDTATEMWFILDLGMEATFNQFYLEHRNNPGTGLRAQELAFYASNDGKEWTEIQTGVTIPTNTIVVGYKVLPETTCRYLKVQYTKWDTVNSSSVQIGEFNLGRQ